MKLPHYWYIWGDQVARYGLDYLAYDHDDPNLAHVEYIGRMGRNTPDDGIYRTISDHVDLFLDGFPGSNMDIPVSEPPFGFQKAFRSFLDALMKGGDNSVIGHDRNVLLFMFDEVMRSFPDDFDMIEERRYQYEHVFRHGVRIGMTKG